MVFEHVFGLSFAGVGIEFDAVAKVDFIFESALTHERLRYVVQRGREVLVVRIEPCHDIARRVSKALVDGVGLPVVLPALPMREMPFVLFYHLQRLIGRTTVDEDMLYIRVVLSDDGLDGVF